MNSHARKTRALSAAGTAQRHARSDDAGVTHTVQMAAMRETEETTSMHSSQFVSVVTATYGSSQLSDAVANDWIVSTSTFVAEAAQHRHASHVSWATDRTLSCWGLQLTLPDSRSASTRRMKSPSLNLHETAR